MHSEEDKARDDEIEAWDDHRRQRAAARVNAAEYLDGFNAGFEGLTGTANPHPRGTGQHHAWQSGWAEGNYAGAFHRAQQHAAEIHAKEDASVRRLAFAVAAVFALVLVLPFIGWLASLIW